MHLKTKKNDERDVVRVSHMRIIIEYLHRKHWYVCSDALLI